MDACVARINVDGHGPTEAKQTHMAHLVAPGSPGVLHHTKGLFGSKPGLQMPGALDVQLPGHCLCTVWLQPCNFAWARQEMPAARRTNSSAWEENTFAWANENTYGRLITLVLSYLSLFL